MWSLLSLCGYCFLLFFSHPRQIVIPGRISVMAAWRGLVESLLLFSETFSELQTHLKLHSPIRVGRDDTDQTQPCARLHQGKGQPYRSKRAQFVPPSLGMTTLDLLKPGCAIKMVLFGPDFPADVQTITPGFLDVIKVSLNTGAVGKQTFWTSKTSSGRP